MIIDILTAQEVAALLRVSKRQVYELVKERTHTGDKREHPVPVLRIGSSVRFRRSDVEEWIESLMGGSRGGGGDGGGGRGSGGSGGRWDEGRRIGYMLNFRRNDCTPVRRPDAEKVVRKATGPKPAYEVAWLEAWFFRLAISNLSGTPARDVQVYLKKVEKADGTIVDKFTPMNLRWANTDPATPAATTRKVLLKDVPVFCDFIHISDPVHKDKHRESLNEVPALQGVMCLDVETTNSAKGHLLGPGSYRFHLYVAAENAQARLFVVSVQYSGNWNLEQGPMFDQEIGFRMSATEIGSL